ncbi:MAG TPA: hypothetical protein VFB30_20300 [Spirochaetia bacterium]|nr:hypothetical protein [Spirochaetia bacterium]
MFDHEEDRALDSDQETEVCRPDSGSGSGRGWPVRWQADSPEPTLSAGAENENESLLEDE